MHIGKKGYNRIISYHKSWLIMATQHSEIVVVPGRDLPVQPWWPRLHSTILAAFASKRTSAFPETWSRLHPDPLLAGPSLAKELGPHGLMVVAFIDEQPVACAGIEPFRGENWIAEERAAESVKEEGGAAAEMENGNVVAVAQQPTSKLTTDSWELCCVATHPAYMGRGLCAQILKRIEALVRERGARRLIAQYMLTNEGSYWSKVGYTTMPGAGGKVEKGWTHIPGAEGLRENVYLAMGEKVLR